MANGNRYATWVRFSVNILNSVPSIIVGLFVYTLIVLTTGSFSAIAGSIALAIVMLPIMVKSTEEAFMNVPFELRQAAYGLGATQKQTILKVVLPTALSSIVTGIMLSAARAAGETAPLIFTALFSQFWLKDIMSPAPSLSVLIYNFSSSPFQNQQNLAWAGAFVLICLVLVANIVARYFTSRK